MGGDVNKQTGAKSPGTNPTLSSQEEALMGTSLTHWPSSDTWLGKYYFDGTVNHITSPPNQMQTHNLTDQSDATTSLHRPIRCKHSTSPTNQVQPQHLTDRSDATTSPHGPIKCKKRQLRDQVMFTGLKVIICSGFLWRVTFRVQPYDTGPGTYQSRNTPLEFLYSPPFPRQQSSLFCQFDYNFGCQVPVMLHKFICNKWDWTLARRLNSYKCKPSCCLSRCVLYIHVLSVRTDTDDS